METVYVVTVALLGLGIFVGLMRLFYGTWVDLWQAFVSMLNPDNLGAIISPTDYEWSWLKVVAILALSGYLTFVFHWKLGEWWMSVLVRLAG